MFGLPWVKAENEVWFYSKVTVSSCPITPQLRHRIDYSTLKMPMKLNEYILKCPFMGMVNVRIEANSVDPDQTAPAGAV